MAGYGCLLGHVCHDQSHVWGRCTHIACTLMPYLRRAFITNVPGGTGVGVRRRTLVNKGPTYCYWLMCCLHDRSPASCTPAPLLAPVCYWLVACFFQGSPPSCTLPPCSPCSLQVGWRVEAVSTISSAFGVVMGRRLGDATSPLAIMNLVDPLDLSAPVAILGGLVFFLEVSLGVRVRAGVGACVCVASCT